MTPDAWLALLKQQRAIAVIRAPNLEKGIAMAKAVSAGGMRLIEVRWNSADPAALVRQLNQLLPECSIGAGTVLSMAEAKAAIGAGATFCVSPHTDPAIVHYCREHQIAAIPGALTPNEIVAAWNAGATAVKVFPINAVGGAAYISSLQGPLGHIPLLPTGGVTTENAITLVQAGAIGVGLSSSLFPKAVLANRHWGQITGSAIALMQSFQLT